VVGEVKPLLNAINAVAQGSQIATGQKFMLDKRRDVLIDKPLLVRKAAHLCAKLVKRCAKCAKVFKCKV